MCIKMVLELTLGNVAFKAPRLITQEWPLSGVYSHMSFQIWFFCKALVTYFTDKRLRVQMCVHMDFQSFHSLEALVTESALERLLAGVNHLVRLELAFCEKLL